MRTTKLILALLIAGAPFIESCGGTGDAPPPGTTPMRQLIAQKRSPVEVVSFGPEANPVVRRFRLTLKNVSDKPVKMVLWTQLFFAADGTLLTGYERESGCSELNGIAPGETYEGAMLAHEHAAKGHVVIKSVTYESVPSGAEDNPTMKMYKLDFQWKNPDHDGAVRALTTDAVKS